MTIIFVSLGIVYQGQDEEGGAVHCGIPISSSNINLFSTNVQLLYSLKTSENRRFFDVFRGYRSGTLVENELNEPKRIN